MQPARLFGQFRHGEEIGLGDAQANAIWISSSLYQVSGMTIHAGNPVLHVGRMVKGRLIPAALMAQQAALGILLGIPVKGEDEFGGCRSLGVVPVGGFLGVGMGLACAMAHFTAGDRVCVRGRKRRMLGLSVLLKFGFVAGSAAVGAHVGTIC